MSAKSEDQFKRLKKDDKGVFGCDSMVVNPVDLGYSQRIITVIALFLCLSNVFLNFDHGALPAGLVQIQTELKFDKATMGSLGSYVYLGFVIGASVNGSILLNHLSYKKILILSFVLNGIGVMLFCFMRQYYYLAFARFLSGFGQILLVIYHPLYIETFCKKNKAIWLPIITLCCPLGTCVGYSVTGGIIGINYDWRDSFYSVGIAMCVCLGLLLLCPSGYININEAQDKADEYIRDRHTQDEEVQQGGINIEFQDQETRSNSTGESQPGIYRELMRNTTFVCLMLGISVLFYVISGILFWSTDYFTVVVHASQTSCTVVFAIISITGPVMGAIASVPIVNKIGYNSKNTLRVCILIGVICCAVSFPIPYYDSFAPVATSVWLLLFFGGTLLPIIQGVMLSQVDKRQRAHSQSLAYLCYNLFGWLPSPVIYGWICSATGGNTSKWGMAALLYTQVFAIIFILIASFTMKVQPISIIDDDDSASPDTLLYRDQSGLQIVLENTDSLDNNHINKAMDADVGGEYITPSQKFNSILEDCIFLSSKMSVNQIISTEAHRKRKHQKSSRFVPNMREQLLTEIEQNQNQLYNSAGPREQDNTKIQNLAAVQIHDHNSDDGQKLQRKYTL